MSDTPLKDMARHRKLKAGHFMLEFDTPGIGHLMKQAGSDFVLFDTEHSGFGIETVKRVMRYMQAAEMPTIVRVPSKDYKDIARALDAGAEGVMLPMVSTPQEAEAIVQSMKYIPRGGRGVIVRAALDRFTVGPTEDKLAHQNERTTLFAQIETADGVKNVDKIAAIDGVDCLWVGHFDLSCSLGVPAQFDHPKFLKAIEKVLAAADKHGKSAGRLVTDVAGAVDLYKQGFDFIAYHADAWIWAEAVAQGLNDIRKRTS